MRSNIPIARTSQCVKPRLSRQQLVGDFALHFKLKKNASMRRKQNILQLGLYTITYPTSPSIIGGRILLSKAKRSSFTETETETDASTIKHKQGNQKVGNPLYGFLDGVSNPFKVDALGREIFIIVLPAIVALAAEPIASLVDTAFIGQIGPVELAAVGVSISIFNIVSKLFNIPLLNVTTSFVAEDEALRHSRQKAVGNCDFSDGEKSNGRANTSDNSQEEKDKHQEELDDGNDREQSPAVSTALVLAVGLGIVEAFSLFLGAGYFLNIMGVPTASPMHLPAEQYLAVRALGAPAAVVSLAVQGVFRGSKDTKTPLYAIGAGNVLNAVLNPILIFTFGFGVSGAAVSTVAAEYFIAFMLLWNLNEKGGLLIGRTIAVLVTMTLGTSMAARQGPIPMAGHQICLQVWLAASMLTDSLALAGQIGLGSGLALAAILFAGFGPFSTLFTNDTAVLEIVTSGVLFVAGSQPINALAFVFDGLYYGVSDFAYAAYSMIVVGIISSVLLIVAPSTLGLAGVWMGLAFFMSLRVAAGFWRLGAKSGPWQCLRQNKEEMEIGT